MNDKLKQNILLALKAITGIASVYFIGLFLYISLSRLFFPLTLDWVEGAGLVQTNRVLLGQELYVAPSAAYVPLVYQPLYFYVAAAFTKLLGFGLGPSRLLSMLASCGCFLLIFLITRKASGTSARPILKRRVNLPVLGWLDLTSLVSSGTSFSGVVAAGLFAATNGVVWTWFDFAKTDMLYIFFSLLGLYFLIGADIRHAILAGIFFTLSFFTKQSAIIIIIPTFVFYFWVNRKLDLLFIATTCLLTSAGILLLNYTSNGWYYLYAFTLPSYHKLDTNPVQINYVAESLLGPILIFLGLVFISIISNLRTFLQNKLYCFIFGLAGCSLVLSLIYALGIGTTRNAFIPGYALFAIASGMGIQSFQKNIETLFSGNVRFVCNLLLIAICLLQFWLLQYKARPYIPSEQDFKRADVLIKELRETDGEFLIPSQNYLALVVNKKVYYHDAALGEFTGWYSGKSLPESAGITQEIQRIVHSGEISVIYMGEPSHDWAGMICEKEETLQSKSKFVPTLYKMRCY
jgi:hypothetical protein